MLSCLFICSFSQGSDGPQGPGGPKGIRVSNSPIFPKDFIGILSHCHTEKHKTWLHNFIDFFFIEVYGCLCFFKNTDTHIKGSYIFFK